MPQTISLPTNRNRDTGVVLLFMSLVSYYAVPSLAYQFGFSYGTTSLVSTPVGLLLMLLGLAGIFLSRKLITVQPGMVVIKDGFLATPLHLRFESTPTFKLAVYEEEHKGRVDEVWTVHLIDEGRQYLVDRRVSQHIAVRSLAEKLAKATQGALIEMHEGKPVKFEQAELDLSFVERAEKYPALMGTPIEEPSDKVVNYQRDGQGILVSWSFLRSGIFMEVLLIAGFLVGAAFIPLPGGPDGKGFSVYQAERATGDYSYFALVAAFTVLAIALLAGYRSTMKLSAADGAMAQATIWGIPVRTARIPLGRIEHIGTSITSRGPYLQLISDTKIVKEMLPSTHIARWLAWEMRQYLAGLGAAAVGKPAP